MTGMESQHLQSLIRKHTLENSGLENSRAYLGLSKIGDCELVTYNGLVNGWEFTDDDHFRASLAFDIEDRLIAKLVSIGIFYPPPEIVAFDGRVEGHPDGLIKYDGHTNLIDIKTVPRTAYLPVPPRLPNKVFFQLQAYLHFTEYVHAHAIYIARDTGICRVIGVTRNDGFGLKIERRINRILDAADSGTPPRCTCHRCNRKS